MDRIRLALVGCGGMGTRHIYGLRELTQTPFCNIELAALCDIRRENAEQAAGEAQELLGTRPQIFTDLEEMARSVPDLAAVDVVTDPSVHHTVVCQALDLGLHVLVEKPLAISVRTCRMMIDAAERNHRLLSVAENYRRDPSCRLVRHLLERGAIGRPYLGTYHSLSPGSGIFITPWRHLKDRGGPLIDMGVHFTDLIRYQLGDVAEVYGDVRLLEPVRRKPQNLSSPYAFYRDRHRDMADEVPATAEDMSVAVFKMESGVVVNWVVGVGGTGSLGGNQIMGSAGVIGSYGSRGSGTNLKTAAGEQDFGSLVAAESGFALEPLAAHFFPTRMASGDSAVDWKLLALELYELGEAILNGRPLEVDGLEGLKDVAAVYAICESSVAGRAVTMSEVESGQLYAYQEEIDTALGVS
ncbi:Gfo/Idh/MocA family protein [Candidatus Latescibacterota bacterium]